MISKSNGGQYEMQKKSTKYILSICLYVTSSQNLWIIVFCCYYQFTTHPDSIWIWVVCMWFVMMNYYIIRRENNEAELVCGNSHEGCWDFRAQPSCEHVAPLAPLKKKKVKKVGFCLLLLLTNGADIGLVNITSRVLTEIIKSVSRIFISVT